MDFEQNKPKRWILKEEKRGNEKYEAIHRLQYGMIFRLITPRSGHRQKKRSTAHSSRKSGRSSSLTRLVVKTLNGFTASHT